jgi:hypothetical protein
MDAWICGRGSARAAARASLCLVSFPSRIRAGRRSQRARRVRAAGQAAGAAKVHAVGEAARAGKVHAASRSGAAGEDGAAASVRAAGWARTDNMVLRAVEGHHG